MRVAWLMPNLHITGGARVAVELSDRMVAKGHRFFILIPSGRYKLPYRLSADVIECGIQVKNPILAIGSGMISMSRHIPEVDILIGCMPPYALLAKKIGKQRGVPALNYLLNDDVHFFDDGSLLKSKLLQRLYRTVARRSIRGGRVFVNSHWTAVQCVNEGGVKPSAFIPHGYNPDNFKITNVVLKDSEVTRLITIGRKMRWKGFTDLIKALNMIKKEKYRFELVVISQDELDTEAAEFDVKIVKPKDDKEIAEIYNSGYIFVYASWFEGFGMPPLEAQACGLPVITTDCGGVREFLEDGRNAIFVNPHEPAEMADRIKKLIDDEALRNRLSTQGLESCQQFTWEKCADKFDAALHTVLDSSKNEQN